VDAQPAKASGYDEPAGSLYMISGGTDTRRLQRDHRPASIQTTGRWRCALLKIYQMSSEKPNLLSPDKPLNDPEGDQLDHSPFAKTLAERILKMTPPEGLVISMYGPWGSGKSTVLNFITHYLNLFPQNERPIVVRFYPRWFTGKEDLTRRFFNQLSAILDQGNLGSDLRNCSFIPTALQWGWMSSLGDRLDAIAKMKLRNHSSTFECLAACGEDVYHSPREDLCGHAEDESRLALQSGNTYTAHQTNRSWTGS
jgi:hypothetical protein